MDVLVLKLVSGEEVVARKENESGDGGIVVSKPRVLKIMQTDEGMGAALMPLFMAAPDLDEVWIDYHSIIAVIDCPVEMEKSYLRQTSGIVLQ